MDFDDPSESALAGVSQIFCAGPEEVFTGKSSSDKIVELFSLGVAIASDTSTRVAEEAAAESEEPLERTDLHERLIRTSRRGKALDTDTSIIEV